MKTTIDKEFVSELESAIGDTLKECLHLRYDWRFATLHEREFFYRTLGIELERTPEDALNLLAEDFNTTYSTCPRLIVTKLLYDHKITPMRCGITVSFERHILERCSAMPREYIKRHVCSVLRTACSELWSDIKQNLTGQ